MLRSVANAELNKSHLFSLNVNFTFFCAQFFSIVLEKKIELIKLLDKQNTFQLVRKNNFIANINKHEE